MINMTVFACTMKLECGFVSRYHFDIDNMNYMTARTDMLNPLCQHTQIKMLCCTFSADSVSYLLC